MPQIDRKLRIYLFVPLLGSTLFFFTSVGFSQNTKKGKITKKIDSLYSLANESFKNDSISKSLDYFYQLLPLADSLGDNDIRSYSYLTLGNIHYRSREIEKAEEHYKTSLEFSKLIGDNYMTACAYLGLGNIYTTSNNKDYEQSLVYYKQALKYSQKINDNDPQLIKFQSMVNIVWSCLDLKKFGEALEYIQKADATYKSIKSNYPDLEYTMSFMYGNYYYKKDEYDLAIKNYEKSIELVNHSEGLENDRDIFTLSDLYLDYSKLLSKTGNKAKAFTMLQKHIECYKHVVKEEKLVEARVGRTKFELNQYKKNIEQAKAKELLQQQIIDKVKYINTLEVIALSVLALLLVLLLKNLKTKKKLARVLQKKNAELEVAKKEAERQFRLKSDFVSKVSHELRTPIYGIIGLSELLENKKNHDGKDAKFLQSLKFSANHLLNLVNDILHISKIESNKVKLRSESFNISGLAQNILSAFQYQLEEKQNKFHLNLDGNLPKFVFGDTLRISQVLINLVGNAMKFTEKGNIWLRLKTEELGKDIVSIRFEVEDDGPGIAKDKQSSVFDNFSQLENAEGNTYQGTGLGLSIVKQVVELFGSNIYLESELGKGSKFFFTIDFGIDHATNESQIVDYSDEAVTIGDKNLKILVVEDNKVSQMVTQNNLEKKGFACDVVENGKLAVEALKQNDYHLVLMDLHMPVMGGDEATKKIREFDKTLPILILTASGDNKTKEKLLSAGIGANDVILKPCDNHVFYKAIMDNILKE